MATQHRWHRWAAWAAGAALAVSGAGCSKSGAPPTSPAPPPAAGAPAAAPAAAAPTAKVAAAPAAPAAPEAAEGEAAAAWDPQQAYRQARPAGGDGDEAAVAERKSVAAAPEGAKDRSAPDRLAADPPAETGARRAEPAALGGEAEAQVGEALPPPAPAKPGAEDRSGQPGKLAKADGAAGRVRAASEQLGDASEPTPKSTPPLQIARHGAAGVKSTVGVARRPPPPSDRQLRPLPPPPRHYPRDARYRSTYLPGRGYLQHLQASIAAGGPGVPSAAAVVQPARPSLPVPTASALKVAIDLSRQQLPAQGGEVAVRVRLRSADQPPEQRLPLRLHLVIDGSGSMKGQPWQQVCAAVQLLAQRLEPRDQLSVTVFNDEAWVMAAPAAGGPLLGELARKVCSLKPRGETNTYAGLQLGYQQARAAYAADAINRVLLISDGMATRGPREPYEITAETASALGQGVTTSGLGVGRDFDALLMNRIALEGGGNHHFVRDAAALPAVIVDELEVLRQQAAEAVDVRVVLAPEVELLEVVGSEPLGVAEALRARQVELATDRRIAREQAIAADRQRDFDGGVRFFLPAFRAGDEHTLVLRVRVAPGRDRREVARLAVRYKDLIHKKNAGFVGGRTVQFAAPDQLAEDDTDPEVLLSAARLRAGFALQRASEYLDPRNLPAIRAELYAAARALQQAADASGSATAHAESARVQALADAAVQAMRAGHERWLASVFHYHWRLSGGTAWAP